MRSVFWQDVGFVQIFPNILSILNYFQNTFSNNLQFHRESHLDNLNRECQICHLVLSSRRELLRHIRRNNCSPIKAIINRHKMRPAGGADQFKCDLCSKSCVKWSELNYHLKVFHHPSFPISCGLCSYRFKSQGKMTRHLKRHQQSNV